MEIASSPLRPCMLRGLPRYTCGHNTSLLGQRVGGAYLGISGELQLLASSHERVEDLLFLLLPLPFTALPLAPLCLCKCLQHTDV